MSAVRSFRSTQFGAPGVTPQSLGVPAAAYPGRIATSSDLMVAVDRQQTTLLLPMAASDASMTVLNPSMIVAYNLLSIDNEIVKTTGPPAGNVVPVSRGFDGTTPAVHAASAPVFGLIDAYHHNTLAAEVHAIEQTLGANLSNIPVPAPGAPPAFLSSSTYNFPAQTPGGTLNPGNNVITLTPVPQGVNGTNTSHYLYISGGTGTAEAVLITGGAAVSGAASGTVIVNCANAHSGAWTIQTATGGIQEALYVAIAGGPNGTLPVGLPTQTTTLYAAVTFPTRPWFPSFSLTGPGTASPELIRAATYPSGDLFHFEQSGGNQGSLYMARFYIYNGGPYNQAVNTGGAAIHIKGNIDGTVVIEDFVIDNGWRGIDIESSAAVTIRNPYIINSGWFSASLPSDSAIRIQDPGATKVPSDIHILGGVLIGGGTLGSANTTKYGVLVEASDGVKIEGVNIIQLQNGIYFYGYSGRPIGVTLISNCILDSFAVHAINIVGNASSIGNISVDHCWVSTRADIYPAIASLECIYVDGSATVALMSVANSYIGASQLAGFRNAGVINGLTFSGNSVYNNNWSNVANEPGVYLRAATYRYVLTGNQIFNTTAGHQKYAIVIEPNTQDGVIVGNDLRPNETGPLQIQGSPTELVCSNNLGVSDVIPSVASAATLPWPINPIFKITGVINVTALAFVSAMFSGAFGSLVTTDGAVTFTAGTTIANTITTVQNRPVSWWCDGTKVYFGQ